MKVILNLNERNKKVSALFLLPAIIIAVSISACGSSAKPAPVPDQEPEQKPERVVLEIEEGLDPEMVQPWRDIEEDLPSLAEKYQDYFFIGAAADYRSFVDEHTLLLKKHFNSIVCENEMKWVNTQPVEGEFHFDVPDKMVAFAEENNMKIRGHCLVWHDMLPNWVFRGLDGKTASKDLVLERLRNHITEVVTHYKGKVYAWDVVNEVVLGYKDDGTDSGEDAGLATDWNYRNSKWSQICGEDYIIEAFRAARAADPDALLFYNDFWNWLDGKREFIINSIVKKLQAENLIDGIGLQAHMNISVAEEKMQNQTMWQTPENLEREIQEYAALGLDVHITELDVSIYTRDYTSSDKSRWFNEPELNEDYQDRLAARYAEFIEMFRRNADVISNVTFWGISDDSTWLSEFSSGRPDHPLLFDKQLKAKKAFYAVMDF